MTSWPFAEYVKHKWGGAWVNSLFRRQGGRQIASEMIRDAVAATRWFWPEVPALGMITFVDQSKVREKSQPGRCYLEAGFKYVGKTKGGLLAFQMLPAEMPEPQPPSGETMNTSFKPSEFDKQAAASLDMIDEQAAAERVQRILHSEPQGARSQAQAGPTLTPAPQTYPANPETQKTLSASKSKLDPLGSFSLNNPRKKRSDAGVPRKPPSSADEITLRVTVDVARSMANALAETFPSMSALLQDQIIAQLQKRLDSLQKQK